MNIELTWTVLWITGGGEGIGRGVALLAAECGAKVAVTAYACSKGAQLVLGQMLALELAPSRIRVNVICPGAIERKRCRQTSYREWQKECQPSSKWSLIFRSAPKFISTRTVHPLLRPSCRQALFGIKLSR